MALTQQEIIHAKRLRDEGKPFSEILSLVGAARTGRASLPRLDTSEGFAEQIDAANASGDTALTQSISGGALSDIKQGFTEAQQTFEQGQEAQSQISQRDSGLLKATGTAGNALKTAGGMLSNLSEGVVRAIPGGDTFLDVLGKVVGAGAEKAVEAGKGIDEATGNRISSAVSEVIESTPESIKTVASDVGKGLLGAGEIAGTVAGVGAAGRLGKSVAEASANVAQKAQVGIKTGLQEGIKRIDDIAKNNKVDLVTEPQAEVSTFFNFTPDLKETSQGVYQNMLRPTPKRAEDFAKRTGQPMSSWLIDRGIIGTPEDTVESLSQWIEKSKGAVDTGLAKIDGKFTDNSIGKTLTLLQDKARDIAEKGSAPEWKAQVDNLVKKYEQGGLTMSEINSAKRTFEKNIKTAYEKDPTKASEQAEAMTNLNSRLREWQLSKAEELGFKELRELNKETQNAVDASSMIMERILRSQGNNLVSLTDWVVLAEIGASPAALGLLGAKKLISSDEFASRFIKAFADEAKIPEPELKSIENIIKQNILRSANPEKTGVVDSGFKDLGSQ